MDSQLLLTAERLQLNQRTVKGAVLDGAFTVKALDTGGYLTIDQDQWDVLRQFSTPMSVPDALNALIRDRKCPALRDFFELVLKAHQAGLLQSSSVVGTLLLSTPWKITFPEKAATWISGVLLLVGALGLVVWPPELTAVLPVIGGALAAMAALSLGNVLAASVMRRNGGEVYRPRVQCPWFFPHFAVDLDDVRLLERSAQVGLNLIRVGVPVAVFGCLTIAFPQASLVPAILCFVLMRPMFGGTVQKIASLFSGKPILDTAQDFLFAPNKTWLGVQRAARAGIMNKAVLYRLGWGVLWIIALIHIICSLAGVSILDLGHEARFWRLSVLLFGVVAVGFVITVGVWALMANMRMPIRRALNWWQQRKMRKTRPTEPITSGMISAIFAQSPLCQQLPPPLRSNLATLLKPEVIPAGTMINDFGQPSPAVWLIVSGVVDVFRRTGAGRPIRAWQAIEGDVFGAEEILDPQPSGWRTKARTAILALRMEPDDFRQHIYSQIGRSETHALVHRVPFLRRIRLCRNWHPQAVTRFARLTGLIAYSEEACILRQNEDNRLLFVVYDGEVAVMQGMQRVAKILEGDFFGEIGMLQNSAATANIMAVGATRCLVINKTDFLRFFTHNYHVALEVERIGSKRLGYPIFPMRTGSSFDGVL